MGEEVFNLDGILDSSQIDSLGLFEDTDEEPDRDQGQAKNTGEEPEVKKTTEVRPEELFQE